MFYAMKHSASHRAARLIAASFRCYFLYFLGYVITEIISSFRPILALASIDAATAPYVYFIHLILAPSSQRRYDG